MDPRLERIKCEDPSPPAVPPKDYFYNSVKRVGCKRAATYGATMQEVKAKKAVVGDTTRVGMGANNNDVTEGQGQTQLHMREFSLGSCPSSDEEEKARSKRAKKVKTKSGAGAVGAREESAMVSASSRSRSGSPSSSPRTGTDTAPSSPVDIVLEPVKKKDRTKKSVAGSLKDLKSNPEQSKEDSGLASTKKSKSRTRPLPMNLQRNPSMFGAELPPLPNTASEGVPMSMTKYMPKLTSLPPGKAKVKACSPVPERVPLPLKTKTAPRIVNSPTPLRPAALSPTPAHPLPLSLTLISSPSPLSPTLSPSLSPALTQSPGSESPCSPATQRVKTLRRVRRLAARRISFGNLLCEEFGGVNEGGGEKERESEQDRNEGCLGSAFQLL